MRSGIRRELRKMVGTFCSAAARAHSETILCSLVPALFLGFARETQKYLHSLPTPHGIFIPRKELAVFTHVARNTQGQTSRRTSCTIHQRTFLNIPPLFRPRRHSANRGIHENDCSTPVYLIARARFSETRYPPVVRAERIVPMFIRPNIQVTVYRRGLRVSVENIVFFFSFFLRSMQVATHAQ